VTAWAKREKEIRSAIAQGVQNASSLKIQDYTHRGIEDKTHHLHLASARASLNIP
jgi:hypothetical protein